MSVFLWLGIALGGPVDLPVHPPPVAAQTIDDCVAPSQRPPLETFTDPTLPAQGYRLELRADRLLLKGADPAGLRYGADTLAQLPDDAACLVIDDAPRLTRRWAHVQLPGRSTGGDPLFPRHQAKVPAVARYQGTSDYLPLLEHLLDSAVAARLNGIVLELNGMWRLPSHPELALPWAAPLESLGPWLARAREQGVEVVPLVPLFTHQEQLLAPVYPELMLAPMRHFPKKRAGPPDTLFWWNPISDPSLPRVQQLREDLLRDVVTIFEPKMVHVGHDEAGALRFTQAEAPDLFAASVSHAHKVVQALGAGLAIWADMLLDGRRIAGTAHGNEAGTPTWKALSKLPADVVLVDWQYHGAVTPWPQDGFIEDVPSLRFLAGSGRPVMGTALGRPLNKLPVPKSRTLQVHQSARIARTLHALDTEGAEVFGHLTAHFGLTPDRLDPWPGTDTAGSIYVAGLHGWTGGEQIWPR